MYMYTVTPVEYVAILFAVVCHAWAFHIIILATVSFYICVLWYWMISCPGLSFNPFAKEGLLPWKPKKSLKYVSSVPQCNVKTIVTGTRDYCGIQRPYSLNFSGLKPRQSHPCTVCTCTCTSDSVHLPVSCFTHNLTWWAHQLVHTGDDSASKNPQRLDTERPRDE